MSATHDRRALLVAVLFMVGLDIACVRRVPHFGEFETTCDATGCETMTDVSIDPDTTAASLTETDEAPTGTSIVGEESGDLCETGCTSEPWCDGECTTGEVCPETCCGGGLVDCPGNDDADRCGEFCVCPRYVFASSKTFTGKIGGLVAADAICNALVNDLYEDADVTDCAGRRRFRALISVGYLRPIEDFSEDGFMGTYILPNGGVVAEGLTGLQKKLWRSINITEEDETLDGGLVWNGVGSDCHDWTSESGQGGLGEINSEDVLISGNSGDCDDKARILCVEVPVE